METNLDQGIEFSTCNRLIYNFKKELGFSKYFKKLKNTVKIFTKTTVTEIWIVELLLLKVGQLETLLEED